MVEALDRHLERDLECDTLLECLYELNDLDRECYSVLSSSGDPMTIDDLSDAVDRERSTVYRSVNRLLERGLLEKEQVNFEDGGYYHVYDTADVQSVASEMERRLNDWYAHIGYTIAQFRRKYGSDPEDVDAPPPVT
ncbi:MAG: helix-turn-helix domain-containing protein [Halodesulfurarchaeum sp.]